MFGNVAEGSRKRRASPAIPDQVAGTFAQPSGSKAPRTQGLGLQAPEAPSAPGASRNSRGKQRERVEDGQSEPAWFPISSLNATLQSYNVGPPPGPPLFTLRFRQQPRYGVALNPAAESNRGARAHFLDPPPIVELLAQKNRDQALLSAAELFVRLELVAADDATSPPPPSNAMFGELLASPYILVAKGQHEKPEALFVYTHVCVKAQGKYRLRAEMFCSARTSITYVASVVSDAFQVYPILRQRPASDAPTALMKSLVRQGFKYKIRKSNQNNAPSAQPRGSRHPPGTAPSAINGTGVSGALPGSRNAAGAPPPVLYSAHPSSTSAALPRRNPTHLSPHLSHPVQATQQHAPPHPARINDRYPNFLENTYGHSSSFNGHPTQSWAPISRTPAANQNASRHESGHTAGPLPTPSRIATSQGPVYYHRSSSDRLPAQMVPPTSYSKGEPPSSNHRGQRGAAPTASIGTNHQRAQPHASTSTTKTTLPSLSQLLSTGALGPLPVAERRPAATTSWPWTSTRSPSASKSITATVTPSLRTIDKRPSWHRSSPALLPSSNWSSGSELNGDNRSLSTHVQAVQLSAAASAAAASAGSAARGPAPIISEPFRSRDEGEPSLSGIGRQWVPSGHPSRGGQVPAPAELAASLPREGEEPARFRPPAPSDRYGTYPGGSGSSTSSHQEVEEPARFRPPAPTDRYGTYPGGGSSSTSSHQRMS
ncbi:hypothetical protein A4X13_0g3555 [Tilletia indica]|uniref:Uncharacterized protein n=1 Tax=Tilletia indica TaxID=43049 RepID=A0A177TL35_9BASI|nr:hypothetical protein A4X13_0g3555 [Tilletia indica]